MAWMVGPAIFLNSSTYLFFHPTKFPFYPGKPMLPMLLICCSDRIIYIPQNSFTTGQVTAITISSAKCPSIAESPSQCQEQSKFQFWNSRNFHLHHHPPQYLLKFPLGREYTKLGIKEILHFVMLQDDEGNEISHTGIKTTLIVEKGSWDDIFHLEGGGYVHMKLQFILSEDERNRIRNVRESALRKKQDRILGRNLVTETATAIGDFKRELSDRTEGTSSSPMRQEDELPLCKHDRPSAEKPKAQSMQSTALARPISEQHAQSKLGVLEINPAARTKLGFQKKDDEKSSSKPEGQVVSGKTSSSVKKMISAFETGLSQERRPLAKTQASKSQPNIVGTSASLKEPLVSKTWQETQTNTGKSGEESSRSALKSVGIKPSYSYKNLESIATNISSEGSSNIKNSVSIKESGTVSGRTNKDRSGMQTESGSVSVAEKTGKELTSDISPEIDFQRASNEKLSSDISPEIDFQRASNEKLKSIANSGDEHYDSESSGASIVPDNTKHLCVTTAGKEVLHFLEDSSTEVNVHQSKKKISLQGKQDYLQGTDPMMKDREKLRNPYESPAEGSAKNGSSGPFGQVFKIAMIIGFGIFVLLNRQKETRTGGTRSKDRNFATAPDYVDQLTTHSEEQWRTIMEKED